MKTASIEKEGQDLTKVLDVAIIGSGFSGIGTGIHLKKAGINNFLIVEASNDIGGTWRDNTYPGAACDVPSHLYSYSFEPNPDWTQMFAQSGEIQAYIQRTADKYGIRPHVKLNTKIVHAEFDNENGYWLIRTENGDELKARVAVSCVGALVHPQIPDLPGRDSYKGQMVHTARWPESIDLRGKRVAVVGSGASAIQVVPAVAPEVSKLYVFQRTPSWIVPKADYFISETERAIYRNLPFVQSMRRNTIFAITEFLATGIVYNTPMTDVFARLARWNMERSIKDPVLREKLIPKYRLGCKRMLISNDWYPALARENVELVDRGVDSVSEKGLVSGGKEYEVDVVIWATGFVSPSAGAPFDIIGSRGENLNTLWQNGGYAYKGVSVHGFPNMFLTMGPNTGPGHTSVLVYTEAQMNYITEAVKKIVSEGLHSVEVKKSKEAEFNHFIDERMKKTTWTSGCQGWYQTKDGRNTTLYPGFASEYVWSVAHFDPADYEISTAKVPAGLLR